MKKLKANWSTMTEEEKRLYFEQIRRLGEEAEDQKEDKGHECHLNEI